MDLYNPSLVATLRRSTLNAVSSLLARRLVMAIVVLMGVAPFISAQQAEPPRHWVVCEAVRFWAKDVQTYQFYITDVFYAPDFELSANRGDIEDKWIRHMKNIDSHAHATTGCVGSVSRERSARYREGRIKEMGDFNGVDSTIEDHFDGEY